MLKKHAFINTLFLLFVFCISVEGQTKTDFTEYAIKSPNIEVTSPFGPNTITRTITQDRKGNIWMATWDGVFRYNGKGFTNITDQVSWSAVHDYTSVDNIHHFSILEDRKGNMWFGSIGGGVFRYDGRSFENFRIKEGLLNNEVTVIYEDKKGNLWFGVSGGASRYDGKLFRNYIIDEDSMYEDRAGKFFPDRAPYEVTSIVEDKTGRFWLGTRGNTFIYDGKTFTVFTNKGKSFTNVRSIIEDKKGNIWLGGNDGLWRYDGSTFTNFTELFVGYIIEDRKGNIWISSIERQGWALSRYDEKILNSPLLTVTKIKTREKMIFGIFEDADGNIWYGTGDGVHRYDGNTITAY